MPRVSDHSRVQLDRRLGPIDAAALVQDPAEAYTTEVKNSLIEAMLDYSSVSLGLGPDEWLTIAARDNEDGPFTPNGLTEAMTIELRIKGSDLAAYRAGRYTKDEAKKHVEVRAF